MKRSLEKKFKRGAALLCSMVSLVPTQAEAIPNLQLYIEGSTYDTTTETWSHVVGADPLRIWIIGNTAGPGSQGDLQDVNLVVSIDPTPVAAAPTISLTGSTTDGYGAFFDPSTPINPSFVTSGMGFHPILSPHSVFDASQYWEQFDLGDMTLADSPIGDFILEMPTPSLEAEGQINVYEVGISQLGLGDTLHFDAFGFYTNKSGVKETFAPYSHDAIGTVVPEPGTYVLLGTTLCATLGVRRSRRKL